MIEVYELKKRFRDVQALNGCSFQAQDGQITGLLGPNGAGKTTCLRIILGLMVPDHGKVLVDGLSMSENLHEGRKRLGLMPDSSGLYERLTAREYIEFFGQMSGLSPQEACANTKEIISLLDMQDIADRRCKGFSQGQRMKTVLGQAIVHRPQNIVLDEPTRGLDVKSTRTLRKLLRRLSQEGHCILFLSHVMHEVSELCDHTLVLASGDIVGRGSPKELCEMTEQNSLEEAFLTLVQEREEVKL